MAHVKPKWGLGHLPECGHPYYLDLCYWISAIESERWVWIIHINALIFISHERPKHGAKVYTQLVLVYVILSYALRLVLLFNIQFFTLRFQNRDVNEVSISLVTSNRFSRTGHFQLEMRVFIWTPCLNSGCLKNYPFLLNVFSILSRNRHHYNPLLSYFFLNKLHSFWLRIFYAHLSPQDLYSFIILLIDFRSYCIAQSLAMRSFTKNFW